MLKSGGTMKKIILIFVSFILVTGAYAGQKKQVFEQASKKAKEIKKINSKVIKIGKKIDGVWGENGKPRLVQASDSIIFLDEQGEVLNKRMIKKTERIDSVSKNGKYIGLNPNSRKFALLDQKGNILWKTEAEAEEGTIGMSFISNEGTVAVFEGIVSALSFCPKIGFYSASGSLLNEFIFEPPGLPVPNIKNPQFSWNGDYFVFGVDAKDRERRAIFIFDNKGHLLRKLQPDFAFEGIPGLALSRDRDRIAVWGSDTIWDHSAKDPRKMVKERINSFIYFLDIGDLDINGKEKIIAKHAMKNKICQHLFFSPDGNYVTAIMMGKKGSVSLINTTTGNSIWEYEEDLDDMGNNYFRTSDVSSGGNRVIIGRKDRKALLFNNNGKLIEKFEVEKEACNDAGIVNISISDDGNNALIKGKTSIYLYKIQVTE